MLFSIAVLTNSARWIIPSLLLYGSAPIYIGIWSVLRVITCVLPHKWYRKADDKLYSTYQRFVAFFFYNVANTKIILYGDENILKRKENVIFISNHQSTVDWIIANFMAIPSHSIGNIRYILKDELKYLPMYGFYFKQHGCIYVKRRGGFSTLKFEKHLAQLREKQDPVWLVIFPEGTRYNPELPDVIDRSRQFAKDEGLEALDYSLSPRLRAFEISLKQLRNHVDAVYDLTVGYSSTQNPVSGSRCRGPSMNEFLADVAPTIHVKLDRIPIDDIPEDHDNLKHWLHRQFIKKEKTMEHFYSNEIEKRGTFPGKGKEFVIQHRETLPAFLFFCACIGLIFVTQEGRLVYLQWALGSSVGGILWMAFKS